MCDSNISYPGGREPVSNEISHAVSTWSSIFRHDGYVSLRTALQAKSAGANTPLADSLATTTAR